MIRRLPIGLASMKARLSTLDKLASPSRSLVKLMLTRQWKQPDIDHDEAVAEKFLLYRNNIGIRLVSATESNERVAALVTRLYRGRGYLVPNLSAGDGNAIGASPRITLEACFRGRTIGTITVNMDSANGLIAERNFKHEIAPYRTLGARLCEFNCLALETRTSGNIALALLLHVAYLFASRIHAATDLFIEVNPRHAEFYAQKLGFQQIGDEKTCERVAAPAVLMHKPFSEITESIARFGGFNVRQNKTFYARGLTPWEENDVLEAIKRKLVESRRVSTHSAASSRVASNPTSA